MKYEFGKYKVVSLIGEGGMNRVYLVVDENGKQWALKQTREPAEIQRTPEEIREQFEREVLTLSCLDHPSLPSLCEYFSSGLHHYIVEEYIDGISLEKYILSHLMSEAETLELAITLCTLLEYLHVKNIIYRDLKPANIIVTKESTLKLLDFDIARIYKKGKKGDTIALGTPGYAAPETYGISQSDARSDIYSLGATLYHILTGDDPQMHPFIFEPIGNFRNDISDGLITTVEKALSRSPEMRYKSAGRMKTVLMKIWRQCSARPPSLVEFLRRVVTQVFSKSVSPAPSSPQLLKTLQSSVPPSHQAGRFAPVNVLPSPQPAPVNSAGFYVPPQPEADEDEDVDDGSIQGSIQGSVQGSIQGSDAMGRTPLHRTIIEGKDALASQLILNGAEVNRRDSSGMAPLDWALMFGRLAVATLLIEKGADLSLRDSEGKTALHRAALLGCREIVQTMLQNGADMYARDGKGNFPLHYAKESELILIFILQGFDLNSKNDEGRGFLHLFARDRNCRLLELFINRGADCNLRDSRGRTPLHDAVTICDDGVASLLLEKGATSTIQDFDGNTPLHLALIEGCLKCAELLVKDGSDLNCANKRGETPLHIAVLEGHRRMIELLPEKGADINAADSEGKTPLHTAVLKGFWSFAGLLIEKGALINASDAQGRTVLHYTVTESQDDQVSFFLDRGADISAKNADGRTPLHCAVIEGDYEMAVLLLERGAPCDLLDKVGMTSYDWAEYYGNRELMELLGKR
ncbi:MAG: ankyrin repeat domain-containing protein [Vulcanimicrobiota bacterium]